MYLFTNSTDAARSQNHSALPDAPVRPDSPGRSGARHLTADALRGLAGALIRLAGRLDPGRKPHWAASPR